MKISYGYSLVARLVFMLSVNLFLVLYIVEFSSFDIGFYRDSFRRNDTEAVTGYAEDELLYITGEVISYLKGDRDDFDIVIEEDLVFGERETLHMIDVKNLFESGFRLKWVSLALGLLVGVFILFKKKDRLGGLIHQTALFGAMLLLFFSILTFLNFELAFDVFHELLFENDLWLLNPRTDTLIQMLPLDFFYRLSFRILRIYLLTLAALFVSGLSINMLLSKIKKYE